MKRKIIFTALLGVCFSLYSQVGINTENPKASLHVNGDMIVTQTPEVDDADVLVINSEGRIGTSATIPAKILFIQSSTEQIISDPNEKTSFNNGDPFIVNWSMQDIMTNNLMEFDASDNSFFFKQDAICEVSGSIYYEPYATVSETYNKDFNYSGAALNIIIQYKTGTGDWEDFTAARALWEAGSVGNTGQTINVPPAIRYFLKDDKIRMVFKRPGPGFGLPHHSSGDGGIISFDGSNFCKSLRITAM